VLTLPPPTLTGEDVDWMELVGPGRWAGGAYARGEEAQEAAKPDVVEHGRRLDDLGGGVAVRGLDHAGERVGEAVRQAIHRLRQ